MSQSMLIVLYLLYGFVFILMGITAIKGYRRSYSVFPLVNALLLMGIFGITHGVSEWITLLRISGAFETIRVELFYVGHILKAISFLALFQFGMVLILRPFWWKISALVLSIYFIGFMVYFYRIVFIMGMDYLYENPFFLTVSLRYLMALPAAILSMVVLMYHGMRVRSLDAIWMRYYFYLGIVIMIYGVLDGFFVHKADFFPASTFHNQWFYETLGIPIQSLKVLIGIALLIGVHFIIQSFAWEKERKFASVKETSRRVLDDNKLKQTIHDDLIQTLYISGLTLDALKGDATDPTVKTGLEKATTVMNQTIDTLRDFIRTAHEQPVPIHDFNHKVRTMIETISQPSTVNVTFHNNLENQGIHNLEPSLLEDVYTIIKELTMNVIKHAQAKHASIVIYQEIACLKVIVSDDGIGFNPSQNTTEEESLGISLITTRIHNRGGAIKFHTNRKFLMFPAGTTVSTLIPLEG